jgi:hypothetical protein
LSVVAVGIISIAVELVKLKTNANSLSMISTEASKFLDKLFYDIRECDNFEVIDETTLDITKGGATQRFYLENSKVYVNDGESITQITSNLTNISQLTFEDWTSVNSDNLVHIEVEFERGNIHEQFQTSIHKR